MAAEPEKKPFSWHVSRTVKPMLMEMGFRPHGASRVLFDRPMGRGLVEYVLWVRHRYCDALHEQWGVRHGACDAYYHADSDYTRQDYPEAFEFRTEAQLASALEAAFQQWLERRRQCLFRMERFLRRNKRAKANLVRWHQMWKEYASLHPKNATDVQHYFSTLPQEMVRGAWKFVAGIPTAPRGNPSLPLWEYFAVLRECKDNPSAFKGSWWDLSDNDWSASFLEHLGNLDALLEPYDV